MTQTGDWRQKGRMTKRRRETAYHEAGHVVIAYFRQVTFHSVSIIPNVHRGTTGHVIGEHPPWFRSGAEMNSAIRRHMASRILMSLAGEIAEAKIRGGPAVSVAGEDRREILNWAKQLWEKDMSSHLRDCWATAARMVERQYWREIEAVANALLVRNTLRRAAVARIIERSQMTPGNAR